MQHECDICNNGPVSDFRPERGTYDMGEVYSTLESVYAPILHMLSATLGSQLSANASQDGASLSPSMTSRLTSTRRNPRPCVLLATSSPTARRHSVCLMATYTKTQIANLPEAFRHFSLAVHPNPAHLPPFNDHVHSIPEWDGPMQWIITIEYKTARLMKGDAGRWRCGQTQYVFGESAMDHIDLRVRTTRAIWQSKCARDPAFAANQLDEVKEHEAEHSRMGSRPNSRNSMGSGRSGRSGSRPYPDPLNRTSMNVPTTIPEDEVAMDDLQGGDENMPRSSRVADIPGGAHRTKSPTYVSSPRGSRTSIALVESTFAVVRVHTADQTDVRSVRSAAHRSRRNDSVGGRFFNQIKHRVLPSRKTSKE